MTTAIKLTQFSRAMEMNLKSLPVLSIIAIVASQLKIAIAVALLGKPSMTTAIKLTQFSRAMEIDLKSLPVLSIIAIVASQLKIAIAVALLGKPV